VRECRYERLAKETYLAVGALGVAGRNCVVFKQSFQSTMTALMERVFFHKGPNGFSAPFRPLYKAYRVAMRPFTTAFRKSAHRIVPHATPISSLQFADLYSGLRRIKYMRAAVRLMALGVCRATSRISAFLKWEKVVEVPGKRHVPRLIQPRTPEYNVAVGRYLKPLEEPLYRIIADIIHGPNLDHQREPVVFKGLNAVVQAYWLREYWQRYDKPVAIGLDASRWDQHVSNSALRYEHSLWNEIYNGNLELKRLLACQLNTVGIIRTEGKRIKYRTKHGRCSGDMNTASGNCLLACALIYSYMKHAGIQDARIVNNGDDLVVILEQDDLNRMEELPSWYEKLGFPMEIEKPVTMFERIEFCQTHPVYNGDSWVMVRNFPSCAIKDSTIIHSIPNVSYLKDYLCTIGLGGAALSTGIPILQEYYHKFISYGGKFRAECWPESGMSHLASGLHAEQRTISPESRVSFYLAFGILPDVQEEIERKLRSVDTLEFGPKCASIFSSLGLME